MRVRLIKIFIFPFPGQNMHTEEVARLAVLAAVRYHRDKKDNNGNVSINVECRKVVRKENVFFKFKSNLKNIL